MATAGPLWGPLGRAAPGPSAVSFAPSALSSGPCAPPPPVGPCASRCPPGGSPSFGGSALWSFPRARGPLLQPGGRRRVSPPFGAAGRLGLRSLVFLPPPPPPVCRAASWGSAAVKSETWHTRAALSRASVVPPCGVTLDSPSRLRGVVDKGLRPASATPGVIVRFIGHLMLWGLLPLSPPPLRPAGASWGGRLLDSVRFIGLNLFWGLTNCPFYCTILSEGCYRSRKGATLFRWRVSVMVGENRLVCDQAVFFCARGRKTDHSKITGQIFRKSTEFRAPWAENPGSEQSGKK